MYNTDIPTRDELPSTPSLLRSTLAAAVVAVLLVVTIILPAEYAIDPTGIGRLTGLAEMGEIKRQLEQEAEADRQKNSAVTTPSNTRSDAFRRLFAGIFIGSAAAHESGHGHEKGVRMGGGVPAQNARVKVAGRTDEMSITLKPGQGAEIKLRMKKGAKANYAWTAQGGKVNFDKHGDGPGGAAKSYKRGRSVAGDDGVLEAAFNGNHGWFWRNRTRKNVTVKLWTNGEYTEIKRVM